MKLPIMKPLVLLCCLCFLWMTGCGKDPEMDSYKENMNQFFENISYFDNAINSIDPNSETAVSDLLSLLDSMTVSFSQMAELSVPKVFNGVEELADEASEYMSEAVSLYHQAFEEGSFDEYVAEAAKENYDRANLRLQYIISILHGEIPEEIFVSEEDSAEPDSAEPDFTEADPIEADPE